MEKKKHQSFGYKEAEIKLERPSSREFHKRFEQSVSQSVISRRTFRDRISGLAAPTFWKSLPMEIHKAPTNTGHFQFALEGHLFTQAVHC